MTKGGSSLNIDKHSFFFSQGAVMSQSKKQVVMSRSKYLRQLCEYAIRFGGWKKVAERFYLKYKKYPDLTGLKLTPLGLRRIRLVVSQDDMAKLRNFRGVNMPGGAFKDAELPLADFTAAFLEQADFQGADLEHVRFVQANIRRANFIDADLTRTVFSGADKADALFKNEDRGLPVV